MSEKRNRTCYPTSCDTPNPLPAGKRTDSPQFNLHPGLQPGYRSTSANPWVPGCPVTNRENRTYCFPKSQRQESPQVFIWHLQTCNIQCIDVFLEFQTGNHALASQAETLAEEIDETLQRINPKYHAKRKSNRLGCMLLHPLPHEAFDRYRTRKLKQGNREAQFKLTHLQQDDTQMNLLFSICGKTTSLSDGEFQ